MVKRLGTGALFRPKSGKYERFTQLILGTEWLTGYNINQYIGDACCCLLKKIHHEISRGKFAEFRFLHLSKSYKMAALKSVSDGDL